MPEKIARIPVFILALIVAVALLGQSGCRTTDATTSAGSTDQDPILARNLAAMSKQPGVLDLGWRQPKEPVDGAASASREPSPQHFPAAEALESARQYSDRHRGLGLIVWYDGRLVASHFSEGVDPATPFAAFSMHKSVLAMAVLAAIEDGIIDGLDDPVGRYIPSWHDDPRGAITLRQLLQQTSGLAHYPLGGDSPRATALALSSRVSATALEFPLAEIPGTQFNYNNVNAQIAGIALENALARSGRRYAEFLSERLWRPVRNHDAALWLEAPGGSPRYYAGLEAGLADWLRLGVLLVERGQSDGRQILTGSSIDDLTRPSALREDYGLNVWLGRDWQPQRRYGPTTPLTVPHAEPYLAPDVVYFDGFGGQRVYAIPSAKLAVARAGEVDPTYDDSVIVNTLLRGLIAARASAAREDYRSDSANRVYRERFDQLMSAARAGQGLPDYDPLIPMPGAGSIAPLPRGEAAWLDEADARWLSELGKRSNSEAIMVWHDGQVVYEDYFGDGSPDHLVTSKSLAKPLSVIAVGRAIEEGYIANLDVPVAQFIDEWRGTDKKAMTVRQVLQMRSGLAPQANSFEPDDVLNRAYLHPYHAEVIINEYPLVTEPGTRYDYSNANGELIAPIIERATGRRYEEWISEAVLGPLGAAGGEIWVNRPGGTAHSGCCALLPAETYLRLALLIKQDGIWNGERLLPQGYVAEITTPTVQNPHAGMGLYVAGPYVEGRGAANPDLPFGKTAHREPYLDRDLYLFDGNSNQVVYVIPRHDLVILRVGLSPPKEDPWDNTVLPNRLLEALSKATGAELVPQPGP